jgi:hypothetical protein
MTKNRISFFSEDPVRVEKGWKGLGKSTGIFHPFVGITHLSAD